MPFLGRAVVNFQEGHIIDIDRRMKIRVYLDKEEDGETERHKTGEVFRELVDKVTSEVLSDEGSVDDLPLDKQGLYYLAYIGGNPNLPAPAVFLTGFYLGQLIESVSGITVDTDDTILTRKDIVREIDQATEENKRLMDKRADSLKEFILDEAEGLADEEG